MVLVFWIGVVARVARPSHLQISYFNHAKDVVGPKLKGESIEYSSQRLPSAINLFSETVYEPLTRLICVRYASYMHYIPQERSLF